VIIQVAERDSGRDERQAEAPCVGGFREAKIPEIAERHVRLVGARIEKFEPENLEAWKLAAAPKILRMESDVRVHRGEFVARGEQKVREAVEIDIEEDGCPCPVGCGHTREPADLRVGSVPAGEEQLIERILRWLIARGVTQGGRTQLPELRVAFLVGAP